VLARGNLGGVLMRGYSRDTPHVTLCRKLHQDPRIYSEFPQIFPKTICAGFQSRDPGAYPCRVAALVSAKPPDFLLSCFYQLLRSTFYLAGSLSITFLLLLRFYGLISVSYDIFLVPRSIDDSHVDSTFPVYKYRALSTWDYPS
jgi:hypothetical protein